MERQEDRASQSTYEAAYERFGDIDGGFKNLEQTVTPESSDWWNANYAAYQERFDRVRQRLSESDRAKAAWQEIGGEVDSAIDELDAVYQRAKQELGGRTAAGRARNEVPYAETNTGRNTNE